MLAKERQKIRLERLANVEKCFYAGYSVAEMAEKLKCNKGTVWRDLRQLELSIEERDFGKTKKKIKTMFLSERKSIDEISKKLGVTHSKIYEVLELKKRRFDIELARKMINRNISIQQTADFFNVTYTYLYNRL